MADSIFQPMRFTIDLDSALVTQTGCGQLIYGDKSANVIEVKVQRGGKTIDLTGVTATGAFYRPVDGAEVPLPGAISANVVSVQLIDECYETEGHYEAEVKLSQGEVRRTILSIVGYVHRAGSGAVVNVAGVVPSIPELLAQISAMDAAAERANTAAARAEALAIDANGYAQNAKQLNGKNASEYLLKSEAFTMELLWTNASVSSNFDAQTISLDLSQYQFVMLEYYSQICGNVAGDQIGALYGSMSEIIKVGEAASLGYVHSYGGDDSLLAVRQRCVRVRTDGIVFATAKFLYLDSTFKVEESSTSCKPYRIYGIKGVAL